MRISDWSSDVCSSDLDDAAVLYSVGETPDAIESLDDVLVDQFYWYIGPATSTIHEAGSRPLAKLFSQISQRPITIATQDTGSAPSTGICQSDRKILTISHCRRWAPDSEGVILD